MKTAYFDAFAGCSGDMILGALLDLGGDPSEFRREIASLGLPVEVSVGEARRASLRGLKVDVRILDKNRPPRKWSDIRAVIEGAPFDPPVRERALAVFRRLLEAEAKVHGRAFEESHLHEAGADDALVDIVGFSLLVERLGIRDITASPLNVGAGWIRSQHGVMPVPAPAVAELLTDVPVYSAHAQKELVTPTGAAILSTVSRAFAALPELRYQRIGWGAGEHDFPDFPNLLRVFYGDSPEPDHEKQMFQIETNIDDSTPQVLAAFLERALDAGALDVFLTPVVMKKGRPASKLTLLSDRRRMDELIRLVFRETSSIGVRYFPVGRRVLTRHFLTVRVLGDKIRIKAARYEGEPVNLQPEFDDCLRTAEKHRRPLKEIMALALRAAQITDSGARQG